MKISILKPIIQTALNKQRSRLNLLEKEKHNPSVSANYHRTLGSVEALEAILDCLNGNMVNIKLLQE